VFGANSLEVIVRPCAVEMQVSMTIGSGSIRIHRSCIGNPAQAEAIDGVFGLAAQDDMKLNADEKRWLSSEIKTQLGSALKDFGDSLEPHGWRKVLLVARQIAPLGLTLTAITSIIIGLGAVAIALLNQAHTRVAAEATFEQKTSDRLDTIEGILRDMRAVQSPTKVLKELGALEPPQLAKNLPALQKISEQPLERVNPSQQILKDVAYKLKDVNQSAEDYWPAVLKFLQFASSSLASHAPLVGSSPRNRFENVSGPVPEPGRIYELHGNIANMTFVDSRIILTDDPVFFKNVRFVNCAFDFPNTDNPPKYLRQMGQQLIASEISSGTVNTGM
jgi:hypothetical protein